MKAICELLLFVACLCASHAHSLPKDFERCKAEDNACILRSANRVLRAHPESFKELHLESVDPLEVKSIRFAGDSSTPVNLDLTMTDLKIRGLSDMVVTRLDGFKKDPKDIKDILLEGTIPSLTIDGKYKTSGKLLVVPITGEGDIHISVKNLQIKTQMKAVVKMRDGKTYVTTENQKIKVKADGLHIDPKNLFNGEKTLADTTVQVINDNWQVLWDEIAPQISDEMSKKTNGAINAFGEHFAYEDIFLQ